MIDRSITTDYGCLQLVVIYLVPRFRALWPQTSLVIYLVRWPVWGLFPRLESLLSGVCPRLRPCCRLLGFPPRPRCPSRTAWSRTGTWAKGTERSMPAQPAADTRNIYVLACYHMTNCSMGLKILLSQKYIYSVKFSIDRQCRIHCKRDENSIYFLHIWYYC
jgi:hypothetical protein